MAYSDSYVVGLYARFTLNSANAGTSIDQVLRCPVTIQHSNLIVKKDSHRYSGTMISMKTTNCENSVVNCFLVDARSEPNANSIFSNSTFTIDNPFNPFYQQQTCCNLRHIYRSIYWPALEVFGDNTAINHIAKRNSFDKSGTMLSI